MKDVQGAPYRHAAWTSETLDTGDTEDIGNIRDVRYTGDIVDSIALDIGH